MKIAFIVWHFPHLTETFILNQITGLLDRGHEVDIFALGSPKNHPLPPDPAIHRYGLLERTRNIPQKPGNYFLRLVKGLRFIPITQIRDLQIMFRSLNFIRFGDYASSLKFFYHTIPFRTSRSYDVIHCQFGELGMITQQLIAIGAVSGRLVVSFRGYDLSKFVRQNGPEIYHDLFQYGHFFLPNCEYFKKALIQLGCPEEKIIVHRSGIVLSKFPYAPRSFSSKKLRFLTVARLTEKKGLEYAIRAFTKLERRSTDVKYHIIGEGPLKKHLKRLILELGLSNVIKLTGPKTHQDVIEMLKESHIFIAPSVTDEAGNTEGIPNTVKEAMSMGLPVLTTAHGGLPELVEDGVTGFLVPEGNADALAERLNFLIDHPEIWPELGKKAHHFIRKNYCSEDLNDELVKIYENVLNDANITSSRPVPAEDLC